MNIQVIRDPQPIKSVTITLTPDEAKWLKIMMWHLASQFVLNGPIDKLRNDIHITLLKELS